MEFSQLQAFICVAKNSSFSLTAEQLHLTQPAISKRISSLEEQLGYPLFDRVGHQVELTEAGRVLLPNALKILHDIEDCKKQIQNIDNKVSGRLSLAASHHIGLHRIPKVLKSYTKKYPDVELDFQFLESEQACNAIRHGEIELAIVTLPLEPYESLSTYKLWDDPLICVVNEEHEINSKSEIKLSALAEYPVLLPKKPTFTRQIIEQPFIDNNLKLNTLMTANDLEGLRMMVEIGLGWSILPQSMLRSPLARIKNINLNLNRALGCVIHKERTLSSSAKTMINLLRTTAS